MSIHFSGFVYLFTNVFIHRGNLMQLRCLSFLKAMTILFIASGAIFAQANQGSITGSVLDQGAAVVPNATVEIRNAETGTIVTSGTSATGNFSVTLPAGTYEISVVAASFKKHVQTGVPVIEGVATRRDVQLQIGPVSDVITVTDTAPLLKTEGGDISYRVTSQTASQLPVLQLGAAVGLGNTRSPLALATVLPGVQFNPAGPQNLFLTLTVNGLPANSQTWMIEGQDATPTLWRGVNSDRAQPGVDAIEAMTVQTSNFAPEFGKAGGAAINYTMKSGTNTLHGTFYDYFVNEALHAGTPNTDYADAGARFAYRSGEHIKNRQRRNDYGFTLGGPIVLPKLYDGRNKSFFFFNFEQFRETQQTATGLATVPTAAYRQGNFSSAGCSNFNTATGNCDFRQPITQNGVTAVDAAGNPIINGGIYDPSSYRVVNGLPTRSLFASQQIPLTSIDRVAKNIQDLFPAPTNANLTSNCNVPAFDNWRHTSIPSIKLDHNLGATLRLSVYWGQTITNTPNNNGFLATDFPWTAATANAYHNNTVRLNMDKVLAPTLMLHVGLGYFHQREPSRASSFDQAKIGLPGAGAINAFPAADIFPAIGGINGGAGGFSPGIGASADVTTWEQKPTANLNLTWVKNNHTFKFGGDLTIQGYPTHSRVRANGLFTFASAQSGNPWENGQTLNLTNPTGFAYASFLLGTPNTLDIGQPTFTRLGGHAFAFYAQDAWKVTRKLTINYGLRYDFQTYLREQYGRMGSASFSTLNPTVGLKGAVAYEASCGCRLSSNYPFAFGPRLSASYQIRENTVFRAGFGVNYNVVQTPANTTITVGDSYTINAPGYGITPLNLGLQGGNTFYKGNPYGNTEVVWPIFDPGRLPIRNGNLLTPVSPSMLYHPSSRPARIAQWSVGLQHQLAHNLILELNYVGNRGAWFYSPLLDTMATNSLGGGQLARYGLDISNSTDRALINQNIGNNAAAAARGITIPYVGFPGTQTVGQALRPVPQWTTVNSYLGPNRGNTWYDSLQFQATKRYSNGIDMNANITYAHAMVLGASSDTDFFLAGRPQVTDPFNRDINKQLNQLVPPLKTVISGTYTTPGFGKHDGVLTKLTSSVVKDWQIGLVLQYQSGQLLTTPNSNNQLSQQLRLNLPAAGQFGAGLLNYNPWNYVGTGGGFFRQGFDPNGSFDPRAYNPATPADPKVASVLAGGYAANGNCAAATCIWQDAAAGQWGSTSPYLEGFRWRRKPSEAFNFGRNFRMGADGKVLLNVRAEFQNILNRMFYSAPATGNPLQAVSTTTQRGMIIPTAGYGVVSTINGAGSQPRTGTIVARLTF